MKVNFVRQKDIADALNVSINTVSHALRDLDDISPETKAEVLKKAKELGYIPNASAINLKTGQTKTIALVYDNLTNPYFTLMATKLLQLIQNRGYNTVIYPCSSSRQIDISVIHELITMQVDGILSFLDFDEDIVSNRVAESIPSVLVGRLSKQNISSICIDDYQGGVLVGEYFKKNNHKNVMYIAPDIQLIAARRYEGLASIYKDATRISFSQGDNTDAILKAIKEENITGLFCFNDVIAILIERELKKHNLKVDIVGFDHIHKEFPFFKDMNSIDYDFDQIAELAVTTIFKKIKNEENSYEKISIPVKFHIKGEEML